MTTPIVLGLDVGGANLKAATADGRAVSVPFALWKQSDKLPAALAELVARFPDAGEFAVTMTGELCDCYETKRQGVNAILDAVESAAACRRVEVWSTDGEFVSVAQARAEHLKVAASNWHALGSFAGRFASQGRAVLLDVGSTTTDIIVMQDGRVITVGKNDYERLRQGELLYTGVRRTPICAIKQRGVAAEHFATTLDLNLVLGFLPESPHDCSTADGRPATIPYAMARLARMMGADREMLNDEEIVQFAEFVNNDLVDRLKTEARAAYFDYRSRRIERPEKLTIQTIIVSGEGEFLARQAVETGFRDVPSERVISLNDKLGPIVSKCAPAYALAVLSGERRP